MSDLKRQLENLRGLGDETAAAAIVDDVHDELFGDDAFASAAAYDLLPLIIDLLLDPRTAGRLVLLEELVVLADDDVRVDSEALLGLLDPDVTGDVELRRYASYALAQLLPDATARAAATIVDREPDVIARIGLACASGENLLTSPHPEVRAVAGSAAAFAEMDGNTTHPQWIGLADQWIAFVIKKMQPAAALELIDGVSGPETPQWHPAAAVGATEFSRTWRTDEILERLARLKAVRGLALWGERARPYADVLAQALDGDAAPYAVAALGMLGDARCVPALADPRTLLHDDLPPLNVVLGPLADHANELLPTLRALLADDDMRVRREVALTFAAWGPAAASATPELTRLLAGGVEAVAACQALVAIGATDALPALEHLAASDSLRSEAAGWACWRLRGRPTDRAGRKIVESAAKAALRYPAEDGLERVGDFGPLAGRYERQLRKLATDEKASWPVRTAAAGALWRVSGDARGDVLHAALRPLVAGQWERWLLPAVRTLAAIGAGLPAGVTFGPRRLAGLPSGWETVLADEALLAASDKMTGDAR